MKEDWIIKFWFTNKNGETEEFEDIRHEWSMEIAVGRALREARATVFKGRRDVKEVNLSVSKFVKDTQVVDGTVVEEPEETLVEVEATTHVCGKCGKQIETNDALCDECYATCQIN